MEEYGGENILFDRQLNVINSSRRRKCVKQSNACDKYAFFPGEFKEFAKHSMWGIKLISIKNNCGSNLENLIMVKNNSSMKYKYK